MKNYDPDELFQRIAHGDDEHRAWLYEACHAYANGEPSPEPRGSGRKERRIQALEEQLRAHGIEPTREFDGGY